MLSNQEQFIIILTSAISGGMCLMAGTIFFVMMSRYIKLMHKLNDIVLPIKLKFYSVLTAGISTALGLFFWYRTIYVINEGRDFPAIDWILFNVLVGFVLFSAALWTIEDFKIRLKQMLS